MIQYFGQDADFALDRSEFGRLVCENCGGRGAKIIVQPPEGTTAWAAATATEFGVALDAQALAPGYSGMVLQH